ncbi:hypothetical protein CVS42_14640 [Aeromonas veronii]|uniref:DUF4435 domain-containing protein n=1 Tax=Aeromonas veronii TaxID=654 RepID=UPI000C287CAE|nr:DUF4435 domain-containing protein [Aeromonas veronii]ATY81950.1 hypothetical protein CVS42_14640 [Aeromonas veronii]
MPEFSYSLEAESVKSLFYNADCMVYVEGIDDIPFWDFMFKKFSTLSVEVEEVGSCTALRPYMDSIADGSLNAIVACDNDLSCFDIDRIEHPNIIRTYGYSIENTLISPHNLLKVIKVIARLPAQKLPRNETTEWLENFHSMTKNLVKMEIHNKISGLGISVVGDNSTRFMTSKTSCSLCEEKITIYESEILSRMHNYCSQGVDRALAVKGKTTKQLTNGHFLFSGTARFLTSVAKKNSLKTSLSYDSIFSNLILSLENTFSLQANADEYLHYENALKKISI